MKRKKWKTVIRWHANPRPWNRKCAVSVLVFVILCVGCQPIQQQMEAPVPIAVPLRHFQGDQHFQFHRMAVLRIENSTRNSKLEPLVRKSLAAAIRRRCTGHVVDVGDQVTQVCELDTVLRNGYPLNLLVETWRRFQADAVVFARIDDFMAYQPMSLGLTMHIVDSRDARLIKSLNHQWTLADPKTLADYQTWIKARFPELENPDLYLNSPTRFVEFIMQRIANQISQ